MFMTIQWYENRFILSKELIKKKSDSTRKFVIFYFPQPRNKWCVQNGKKKK